MNKMLISLREISVVSCFKVRLNVRLFVQIFVAHFLTEGFNTQFPGFFKPRYQSKAKCNVFTMKISVHSYANKTTRNWPISNLKYSE